MQEKIVSRLKSVKLGDPQSHGNIAIFPIADGEGGSVSYITLSEALEGRLLTVTEVSQGGSVPELKVTNSAETPVLLLDGEELAGAKQNRVLNTTVLVPEKQDIVIPVSCTEQGRWAYATQAFYDSGTVMARSIRARKNRSVSESLASSASFRSDQGEVLLHDQDVWDLTGNNSLEAAFGLKGQTVAGPSGPLRIEEVLGPGVIIVQDAQGQNQYLRDADLANTVSPRRRDQAYGLLVRNVLPWPLTGFFAAVMVGAILSSFNSALNSTATLFSLGVYRDLLHPGADERQVIRAGKIFGGLIAVSSMTVAPLLIGQKSIFAYLQKMNGLYFIPIFAVVLVGMLSKRVPSLAAKLALILGFTAIAAGYFIPGLAPWVAIVGEFHFLGIVFAGLILLMLVVGWLAPRETPWQQEYSGDVDMTPWRLAWPVGLGLAVVVALIYVLLADPSVIWPTTVGNS